MRNQTLYVSKIKNSRKKVKIMKNDLSESTEKKTLKDLWQYIDMAFITVLFILILCVEIVRACVRTMNERLHSSIKRLLRK